MFGITRKPTKELLYQYMNDNNAYFRYQNPKRKLDSTSKSWGMIYSSEVEALEDGTAVEDGKSACNCPRSLALNYGQYYNNSYVVLVFAGNYNGTGADGESIVQYTETLDVFNKQEFEELLKECGNYVMWDKWFDGEWLVD
jgi:hypothetical protein